MGDVHYIVDKLNAQPFAYNLSLLAFTEKTPLELLQLLSDVFARISPKHQNTDVAKEDPDMLVERLVGFLRIIKYKPNQDQVAFRQALGAGDKDAIYPILKWVVPQPQLLEKRAFVGYYLSFPDMPEELNYDPEIMELKEEIKVLQQAFVETHKSNDTVKAVNKDTLALKARIKSLEEERERLADKVERAKGAVERVADKASYLDVCTLLRKQQDEEVDLSQKLQTQRQLLERSEQQHNKVATKLKELTANYQEGSSTKLLDALAEDVKGLRYQVSERYPKELERRQRRATALQEAFTNGVNTEMDLQKLQGQANQLHQQIAESIERRAVADRSRAGDKAFMQLRQAQQMANMVAKKKDELTAKMDRLQEKKGNLTAQMEKLTAADGSGLQMVSEEEWRTKYEAMKAALPQYKRMKKELGDVEAEVFVLAYTEEVLDAQEAALTGNMKDKERRKGVAGFSEVVTGIEKVSEQKSAIDEVKGSTLAEISRTVEDINNIINERKTRLAPQIKKLRTVRQAFSDLETEHAQVKAQHDAAMAQYESKVSHLEAEVGAMQTETLELEQRYHLLSCQLGLVDQCIKRVGSGPPAERLRERNQTKVAEAEDQTRALKEKQRDLKEKHTTGLSQIDMMNDLVRLLQIKLESQRRDLGFAPTADTHTINSSGDPVHAAATQGTGVVSMQSGGVKPAQSFHTSTSNVMVL